MLRAVVVVVGGWLLAVALIYLWLAWGPDYNPKGY